MTAGSNGTSRFYIRNNGNIIIGDTTDAGYKLDVNGTARFASIITATEINLTGDSKIQNTNTGSYLALYGNTGGLFLGAFNAGANQNYVFINASTGASTFSSSIAATNATFSGQVISTGNATNSSLIFNNPTGSTGTAQYYADYKAGGTVIGRILRGNGASGYEANGLNIDNFAGMQIKLNSLGGSGGTFNVIGGAATFSNDITATNLNLNGLARIQNQTAGGYLALYGNSGGLYLGAFNAGGNQNYMFIRASDGNVFVNTTSGVSGGGALQVNGNVNINGVFQINGTTIGGGGGSGVTGSGTTNFVPKWSGSTSLGNSVIQDNGSQIGIGVSPSFTLDVSAPSNNQGIRINSVQAAALYLYSTFNTPDNRNWGIFNNSQVFGDLDIRQSNAKDGNMTVGANSTSRFHIKNNGTITINGNLLLNTSTDNGYKLQINGSASFAYGFLSVYRGSSSPNDILVGNDGNRFYIGGNTYVAGTITTTSNISVTGSVTATGGFFDTSDSRLKILVKDYEQPKGIENVAARMYVKNNRKELGYFAQDLQEILPSAVIKGEDGFLTLSYTQVHTAKIAYLEDKVAQLEELIKSLL
jgi:hypothetical protein